jgi:uncharacterized integral membrane protein
VDTGALSYDPRMADETKDDGEGGLHPAMVGAVVLALVAIDFIVQNTSRVRVHFLFLSKDAPVWLLLLVTSAVAIGAAEIAGWSLRRRRNG